jgi:hypothetical protein
MIHIQHAGYIAWGSRLPGTSLKQGHDIPGAFLDHQELHRTKDTSEEAEKDPTTTSLENTYYKTTFQHLA